MNKFIQKSHLLQHVRTVHEEIKPFMCEICQTSFSTKYVVERHIAQVHEKKKFLCPHCPKKFFDLNYHIKFVHEVKPYPCHLCSITFIKKSGLENHISAVHEKKRP